MGIYNFYSWFKTNYSAHIQRVNFLRSFNLNIDTLIVDMNGVFHTSAQRIHGYGRFTSPQTTNSLPDEVVANIRQIVSMVKPSKNILLFVDGVAPVCKMEQQRQRRFKNAVAKPEFDPNRLSAGTDTMREICDAVRRAMPSFGVHTYLSDDLEAGEGEHKAMSFIRANKRLGSICIHGSDADLIVLGLLANRFNFYVLREDNRGKSEIVNVSKVADSIKTTLDWHLYGASLADYNPKQGLTDFCFLTFLLGNDFLPHVPSIEILENGIEKLIEIYHEVAREHGHLTQYFRGRTLINYNTLRKMFERIGHYEKELLEAKISRSHMYFPDNMLEQCTTSRELDIEAYKRLYNESHFGNELDASCRHYLDGLQFVLQYYTSGVRDWRWKYGSHYAPFASDLARITNHKAGTFTHVAPLSVVAQLAHILPPQSSYLLPSNFRDIYTDKRLVKFFPTRVEVDLSGKRREYQGIIKLDAMDTELLVRVVDEMNRATSI